MPSHMIPPSVLRKKKANRKCCCCNPHNIKTYDTSRTINNSSLKTIIEWVLKKVI
ncbi:hypothetical protein [Stenotrophomonas phage RAS14]